mmetsp:Transcript_153582/g.491064  ORF Transcript_153582/g.491064 Transcript_153582/m.491064 type:complete len:255 (+) Transcript_153582:224-988(+)
MRTIARDNAADRSGYRATLGAFDSLATPPKAILEVGLGSGDFARLLASRYQNSTVLGIDASEFSVHVATSSGPVPPNLRFELRSSVELSEPPNSFDVITTTFVNHEIFPDTVFVDFLRRVGRVGRQAFIFNDFVRSFGCLAGASVVHPLIRNFGPTLDLVVDWLPIGAEDRANLKAKLEAFTSQTPFVMKFALDSGFQSMRRSFTVNEYKALFKEAGFPEGALRCNREEGFVFQDFLGDTCRMVCVADLTMVTA